MPMGIGLGLGLVLSIARSGGISAKLPNLASAIKGVLAGSGRARFAIIGDSVNAGWGDNGAGGGGNINAGTAPTNYLRANSPAAQLKAKFQSLSIPCRSDAIFGDNYGANTTVANYVQYNPAVTLGTGWTFDTTFANRTIGGCYFQCPNTATTSMAFTPEVAANRFDILYAIESGDGTFTVTDSSGTLATINADNAASSVGKQTVSRASSSTLPISIQRNGTGGAIKILAIIPYDTTSPSLEIWNLSQPGSAASNHWIAANLPWSPANMLPLLGADFYKIELGLNDSKAGASASLLGTSLQSIIGYVKVPTSDVLLYIPHKAGNTGDTYYLSAGYLAVYPQLATTNSQQAPIDFFNNVSLVSATDRFDVIHLTAAGYQKKTDYEFALERALVGI